MSLLEIKNLHISIGDKAIVKGFNLTIKPGEVHAIMGPNGTGKSTLAKAIAGHPSYTITGGDVILDGKSILAMQPDERARSVWLLQETLQQNGPAEDRSEIHFTGRQ